MLKSVLCILVLVLAVATAEIIPNNYIVVFKDNTPLAARERHLHNISSISTFAATECLIKNKWEIGNFSGYAANIYSPEILKRIVTSQDVESVEPDQVVTIQACDQQVLNQQGLWGLNRITSIIRLPVEGYRYNQKAGEGIDNYVIDTGILTTHADFAGRARLGASFVTGESTATDLNGHGTHCAGTIGGTQFGIAKKSTLVAVKVLGKTGSGTLSGIISGCEWVVKDHDAKKDRRPGSTANLSLGSSKSDAVNKAVNALFSAGVFVAVAAGNDNKNACNYSPASAELATSVGATDSSDIRAYFSNWGQCVDVFAPGRDILSAWIGTNTATNTISGTSMASPHVAGVASVYLSLHPEATPQQVKNWLLKRATNDVPIGDLNIGSPDRLLFQGCY